MLLDEWSDKELDLARAIDSGRGVRTDDFGRPRGGLDDDPRRRRHAGSRERDGFGHADLGDALDDDTSFDALGALDQLDAPDRMDRIGPGYEADDEAPVSSRGRAGARGPALGSGEWKLALDHMVCGGDGVVLSLAVGQQPARVWVDAVAWCEWLRPRLPIQRVDQIPSELMPLLGEWTLLPVHRHAEAAGLHALRFVGAEPGHCARVMSPTLSLIRDDTTLTLRLLDWPGDWIEALARTMEDRRVPLVVPPIPMSLAAGWVRLTRAQLRALRPGDGIALDQALSVETGHAWLIAERPLARLRFDRDAWSIQNVYHEDHPMQDLTDSMATDEELCDEDIVLTAVAELGRMSLSLDTLRGLHAGQVLDIPHASHGRVTLTVSGQPVATGTLLRVGERLVMRVD